MNRRNLWTESFRGRVESIVGCRLIQSAESTGLYPLFGIEEVLHLTCFKIFQGMFRWLTGRWRELVGSLRRLLLFGNLAFNPGGPHTARQSKFHLFLLWWRVTIGHSVGITSCWDCHWFFGFLFSGFGLATGRSERQEPVCWLTVQVHLSDSFTLADHQMVAWHQVSVVQTNHHFHQFFFFKCTPTIMVTHSNRLKTTGVSAISMLSILVLTTHTADVCKLCTIRTFLCSAK